MHRPIHQRGRAKTPAPRSKTDAPNLGKKRIGAPTPRPPRPTKKKKQENTNPPIASPSKASAIILKSWSSLWPTVPESSEAGTFLVSSRRMFGCLGRTRKKGRCSWVNLILQPELRQPLWHSHLRGCPTFKASPHKQETHFKLAFLNFHLLTSPGKI